MRPQVAADLLEYYRVDLDEWLGDYRFGALLDLILQLPDPKSRFRAALNEDRELYEMIIGPHRASKPSEVGAPDGGLPYQLIGTTESLLLNQQDQLALVISILSAQGVQRKPKKPKPSPRPVTMAARLQSEADELWADDFLRDLGYVDE